MHASSDDAPVTDVAPGCDPDTGGEPAFRRSLRASRARRSTAALRRRRILRGRRSLMGAAVGLVVLSAGAFADGGASSATRLSKQTIKEAQRALGVEADGAAGPQTRKATRRFQRKNKLEVDGALGPQTLEALGVVVRGRTSRVAKSGEEAATLERIAQCESGGDPTAVSASGRYHGKYQFSRSTWRSVGGKGDPAAAPEDEQDRRAATLLRRSGTAPWPNCA